VGNGGKTVGDKERSTALSHLVRRRNKTASYSQIGLADPTNEKERTQCLVAEAGPVVFFSPAPTVRRRESVRLIT